MSKIAVIYWSGTGNTEAMADLVATAASAAGAAVDKFTAAEFNVATAGDYTGFALGCPAMGAEQLEESEVEPIMANGAPDGDAETACAAMGTALANT